MITRQKICRRTVIGSSAPHEMFDFSERKYALGKLNAIQFYSERGWFSFYLHFKNRKKQRLKIINIIIIAPQQGLFKWDILFMLFLNRLCSPSAQCFWELESAAVHNLRSRKCRRKRFFGWLGRIRHLDSPRRSTSARALFKRFSKSIFFIFLSRIHSDVAVRR